MKRQLTLKSLGAIGLIGGFLLATAGAAFATPPGRPGTTAGRNSIGSSAMAAVAQSTTTTLTVAPASPQFFPVEVTLTATISPSTATGTVQFMDGTNALGSSVTVSGGSATFFTSSLLDGSHSLAAAFTPGDPSQYTGSTSNAVPYTINFPPDNTTLLTVAPAFTQMSGQPVTLTASESPTSVTGTVQFYDGTSTLGSPVMVSGGTAVLIISTLAAGSHALTAVFTPGDPTVFSPSTSAVVNYTITAPIQSGTSLTVTPAGRQCVGMEVTLTASISPSTATGTVQFMDGTVALGGPVTVAGGSATLFTTALGVGSHSLTAAFAPGDTSQYSGSTSSAMTYSILAGCESTTTLMVTPASPQVYGQPVTLTAIQSPSNATGTVQFYDGSAQLGSPVTLSASRASLTTSTLAVGNHSLTAVFISGDPSMFGNSTSIVVGYTITAPNQSLTTLTVSPAGSQVEHSAVMLTATINPSGVTGTVQFLDGATALGEPVPVSGGAATLATSTLAVGSHSFTAVFRPGDPNQYNGSTSNAVPYTINPPEGTTTTLTLAPSNSQILGSPVTLTAVISPSLASGTVQFMDGSTAVGSPVSVAGGTATLTTSTLAAGSHTFTAVFTPATPSFTGSTSAAVKYRITMHHH